MPAMPAGICQSWEEKVRELPEITGDREMVRRIWDEIEGLASFVFFPAGSAAS